MCYKMGQYVSLVSDNGRKATDLIKGQHLTGHLTTIVEGDSHAVVDLEYSLGSNSVIAV